MVETKEWLFNFDESFCKSVNLRDDSKMHVMGNKNLKLHMNGITQVIIDVYYLSHLKTNLLIIVELMQKELTTVFKDGVWEVFPLLRKTPFVKLY